MLKYVDTMVTFSEVPYEISLCINISNCPCHREGCHSSYLANDIGEPLTEQELKNLIDKNDGISCVAFMGGDSDPKYIHNLAMYVKDYKPSLKVAWYSGRDKINSHIDNNLHDFDFIKIGPYIKEKGPLNSETTNQKFYKIVHLSSGINKLIDWTYKFKLLNNKYETNC